MQMMTARVTVSFAGLSLQALSAAGGKTALCPLIQRLRAGVTDAFQRPLPGGRFFGAGILSTVTAMTQATDARQGFVLSLPMTDVVNQPATCAPDTAVPSNAGSGVTGGLMQATDALLVDFTVLINSTTRLLPAEVESEIRAIGMGLAFAQAVTALGQQLAVAANVDFLNNGVGLFSSMTGAVAVETANFFPSGTGTASATVSVSISPSGTLTQTGTATGSGTSTQTISGTATITAVSQSLVF